MAASTSENPPPPPAAADNDGSAAIPPDILQSHVLNHLDGRSLAFASCASRLLHRLSSHPHLWSHLCRSTWPSISTSPRLRHIIASAPGGPRSFFSDCFLLLPASTNHRPPPPSPDKLISAVDIRHGDTPIFSQVQETDVETGWFRCSPFRIDMLGPKESVQTPVMDNDGACASLSEGLRLSWIVVDPARRRVADLSSGRAVSVRRHWLSGEVEARFAAVLKGDRRGATEYVEFGIVVTCAGAEGGGGGMHVREVSLRAEDMEGKEVNGRDGMVILRRALEGKRAKGEREEEGKRRYEEYLERKRERRERRATAERRLDRICVAVGGSILAVLCLLFLCS